MREENCRLSRREVKGMSDEQSCQMCGQKTEAESILVSLLLACSLTHTVSQSREDWVLLQPCSKPHITSLPTSLEHSNKHTRNTAVLKTAQKNHNLQ